MWLISLRSSCFDCGSDPMDHSCQQGARYSGGVSMCGEPTWHGLDSLAHLNTSLTSDYYVALLCKHLQS